MSEVTDAHREAARAAIRTAFEGCERHKPRDAGGYHTDKPFCECGKTIDGCKAEVEAIARAIAAGVTSTDHKPASRSVNRTPRPLVDDKGCKIGCQKYGEPPGGTFGEIQSKCTCGANPDE